MQEYACYVTRYQMYEPIRLQYIDSRFVTDTTLTTLAITSDMHHMHEMMTRLVPCNEVFESVAQFPHIITVPSAFAILANCKCGYISHWLVL